MPESTTRHATTTEPRPFLSPLLLSRFLIALLCFVAINLILARTMKPAEKLIDARLLDQEAKNGLLERTWSWWTARSYLSQVRQPDLLLLGSSQMGSATFASDAQRLNRALDCVQHRRAATLELVLGDFLGQDLKVFNGSQAGAMVSDAYMFCRALLQGEHKPKLVIIGISPRDFMDNSLTCPGATEPFRFFCQFVDPGKLTAAAFPDPIARLDWLASRVVPLRRLEPRLQHFLTAGPGSENAPASRNRFIAAISGSSGAVRPGEWLVPANMPYKFIDNTREYENRYHNANPPIYPGEMEFFKELLSFVRGSGIKVLVVGMPSLNLNRELLSPQFWQRFHAQVACLCSQYGARWVDLSDHPSFEFGDYLDTVHLNARGGAKLFDLIARAVASDRALESCLKPHDQPERAVAGDQDLLVPR